MNCGSRIRAIALAAALGSAGTSSSGEIRPVQRAGYQSEACWFDRHGDLGAFLVLGRDDRFAVPYLISTKCVVSAGYGSYGEATVNHLNAIRLVDRYGVLQRALPQLTILDNDRTDLRRPSGDSILYYIRARLTRLPTRYLIVYAPRNVAELTETNMSFERFLRLSGDERERLAREYERR